MSRPLRLQLSRRKGFSLQAHSHAINELPAVVVARPGKWGNPYRVGPGMPAADAVMLYRSWLEGAMAQQPTVRASLAELRGKNLACWCPLGETPCHADVLLDLANRETLHA